MTHQTWALNKKWHKKRQHIYKTHTQKHVLATQTRRLYKLKKTTGEESIFIPRPRDWPTARSQRVTTGNVCHDGSGRSTGQADDQVDVFKWPCLVDDQQRGWLDAAYWCSGVSVGSLAICPIMTFRPLAIRPDASDRPVRELTAEFRIKSSPSCTKTAELGITQTTSNETNILVFWSKRSRLPLVRLQNTVN